MKPTGSPDTEIYRVVDALLDEQRPALSGGEMAQLLAMKEIDRLLDIRLELGRLAVEVI